MTTGVLPKGSVGSDSPLRGSLPFVAIPSLVLRPRFGWASPRQTYAVPNPVHPLVVSRGFMRRARSGIRPRWGGLASRTTDRHHSVGGGASAHAGHGHEDPGGTDQRPGRGGHRQRCRPPSEAPPNHAGRAPGVAFGDVAEDVAGAGVAIHPWVHRVPYPDARRRDPPEQLDVPGWSEPVLEHH